MKKEDIEKLILERRTPSPPPPTAKPDSPTPPGSFKTPNIFLGKVGITYDTSDEADVIGTLQLLESTIEGETFTCHWCDFATTKPDEMIEHLAIEINKNLDIIAAMYKRPPKHSQGQQPPENLPGNKPV